MILEGPIGQSAQIERRKGNKNVLAKYKDVKVLEMKTANWSRAEALSLMENWLTAHSGKINGIIGQNDEMALGAIEAVKAKGIDPKTIPTAGIDGVTDAVRAVKDGSMVSVLQDAAAQAQGGPRCPDAFDRRPELQAAVGHLDEVLRAGPGLGRWNGQALQHSVDADHQGEC